MTRRKRTDLFRRRPLFPFLRKPAGQLAVVLLVALIVYLIAVSGVGNNKLASEVNVDEAFLMYQDGAYVLDVSWPAEWDEYHIPAATLIPLDQLYNRLGEVPRDRDILIVSRSSVSSQQARDLLLSAGLNVTSMSGSLNEWYIKGYPIEGAPPQ